MKTPRAEARGFTVDYKKSGLWPDTYSLTPSPALGKEQHECPFQELGQTRDADGGDSAP